MVTSGSPKSCLRIRLGDKEILKEPGAAEFVRAELKLPSWRMLPEQISATGKEIEFTRVVPVWIGAFCERNDCGGFAPSIVEEVSDPHVWHAERTGLKVVHECRIRVTVGPECMAFGVRGDEGVHVVPNGEELGGMAGIRTKGEGDSNGGGEEDCSDEGDAPAQRREQEDSAEDGGAR